MSSRNRVEVLHGVNLDMLGRRDPEHYGDLTLGELETKVKRFGRDLDLEVAFFQTNHEGDFVERLHRLPDAADAAILNAGAWTHYSWAIRDALEISALPAIEVHLSDVGARESWRHVSVLEGLVLGSVSGKGPDGYREALAAQAGARPMSEGARAERLAALLAEQDLDQLIVGDLVRPGDSGPDQIASVRWLTGYTGSSGLAIVGPRDRVFITDFRYVERAEHEVDASFERVIATARLVPELASRLAGRVGFDEAATSVANLRKLEQELGEGVDLVATEGVVEGLRRQKDPAEQAAIAEAARLADEAYESVLAEGLIGRSEGEVARAAEARIRELGAEPSFPAIVAAGPNGALPHAEPSEREIGPGELVVWDMGAQFEGYASDCTRTFATAGALDPEASEVYELVREAQAAALEAVAAGVGGREADEAARSVIREAGHEEHFGHGLGHGVGLEVHEAPRMGNTSEDVLIEGDVVSVEPGVYLPGRFGVRIEDLVVVSADGHRNLSSLPKELRVVD
jgi:3-dehydroquinate dehydratase type II